MRGWDTRSDALFSTAIAEPDPKTGKRPPVYVKEQAPWSAVRSTAHSHGFAACTIDPGSRPGDFTTDRSRLL